MADVREVNFSPYFEDGKAREYAVETVEEIAGNYDFESVADNSTYVDRPMFPFRAIPGFTDFAISAEGTKIRYNKELVDDEEVMELVDERFEESRQEFTSWKALRSDLGE